MKEKSVLEKLLKCLFLIVFLFIGWSIVSFFLTFLVGQKFYLQLTNVITGSLIVFIVLWVFRFVRIKVTNIIFVSCLIICTVVISVYEFNKNLRDRLATVNEQGVNLYDYQPFLGHTKTVSLDEPSTLKIESDLPKLDGATALYPLYAAFAQATYPEKEYKIRTSEVMCTTTVDAYTNLIKGNADIIFAAAPSKKQLEEAKSRGIELKLTPIGREAFVFFVNSNNKVNELSSHQIQGIYSGRIRNWSEVGGNNDRIRAFQRPDNSGSQTMLQKMMEGKQLMTPPKEDIAAGMGDIIEKIANYRNYNNAIGYSFLFFATQMIQKGEIRLIDIDSIPPNKSTIQNGEYPLTAEFYAITANSKNPNIEAFLQWILSPQGQFLVQKTGYTPI